MDEMYDKFKFSNKKLFKNYNEKIVKPVFREVSSYIDNHKGCSFSIDDISGAVQYYLKKDGLVCLNLDNLIVEITDFLTSETNLYKDTHENHAEMIKKIVWRTLSEYINDATKFTDSLASAIIAEFSNIGLNGEISTLAITEKLIDDTRFKFLSIEAVNDAVNSTYDYYYEKGFIV